MFGACGLIFGNATSWWAGSGRKYAAGESSASGLGPATRILTEPLPHPTAPLLACGVAHVSDLALDVVPRAQEPAPALLALDVADAAHGVDERDELLGELLKSEKEAAVT